MTISSQTRTAGPFTGNGVTTTFPFTFKVFATSDIYVVRTDSVGNDIVLALGTDYTVTLNANQNSSPGGSITLPTALVSGYKLTATSALQYLQPTDLTNQGGFYPKVINNALDYLTILVQQLLTKVGNSLQLPISVTGVSTTLPTPSASKVIGWNSAANALQNFSANDLGSSLAYGQTAAQISSGVLNQTQFTLSSSAVTVNNLKVAVGGVNQRPGIDYTLSSDGLTVTFTTAPPAGTNNICFVWQQALSMGTVPTNGVGTAQIIDANVTAAKLASGAAASNIGAGGVTTAMHADQSVTTAKIVDANVTPAKLANSGYELGLRNRIINGGFRIGQRGTSFTFTNATSSFVVDRWFISETGDGVSDEIISLIADSEGTSQFALRINQYKAAGFDGGNSRLIQIIEADATADLAGQVCTLSFKHACGSGIAFSGSWIVAVRYDTNDSTLNSAAATGTAFENLGTGIASQQFRAAGLATTSYTKTTLSFTVPAGAKRVAVVFYSANSTNNAVLDIKEVQLEKGAVATPFEFRPYSFELAQCQRYFEYTGCFMQSAGTGTFGGSLSYSVTKRAGPTVTFSNIIYNGANSLVYQSSFGSITSALPFNVIATGAGGYVSFNASVSAEL